MTDLPEHVREFDPNAKPAEPAKEPEKPPRTPSIVLGEFFRKLVELSGTHPQLEVLLNEFEALTAAPAIPAPAAKEQEPST